MLKKVEEIMNMHKRDVKKYIKNKLQIALLEVKMH